MKRIGIHFGVLFGFCDFANASDSDSDVKYKIECEHNYISTDPYKSGR